MDYKIDILRGVGNGYHWEEGLYQYNNKEDLIVTLNILAEDKDIYCSRIMYKDKVMCTVFNEFQINLLKNEFNNYINRLTKYDTKPKIKEYTRENKSKCKSKKRR